MANTLSVRTLTHHRLVRASLTIAISAARASSGVLTGWGNASRTGRGPSDVFADISNPYRSMLVIAADEMSRAFENAVQYRTSASA